jgi:hypothetical protein
MKSNFLFRLIQLIAYLSISVLFSCEHFSGRVLSNEELVSVPGLDGTWVAYEEGKEVAILKIQETEKNHEYNLLVENDNVILRIAIIKDQYVGEYHEIDDKGVENTSGHFFILKKVKDDFQIYIGTDITKKMVQKYKLIVNKNVSIGKNQKTFSLSGTTAENRKALDSLISDPDFFHLKNNSYNMILKRKK